MAQTALAPVDFWRPLAPGRPIPVEFPGQIQVSMNFDDNNSPPPNHAAPGGLPETFESPAAPAPTVVQEFQPPPAPVLPEDLRAPWGWTDLVLLGLITFVGTFVASVILAAAFAAFGVKPAQLQHSVSEKNLFIILNQALLSLVLFAYLFTQMRYWFKKPFWTTIGWRELETGKTPRAIAYLGLIFGGFAFSVLIQLASAGLGTKVKMPIEALFQDRRSAFLLMLMGVLVAPLVEETIFRGYVYPVVARTFGVGAGVIVTGTLFGLLHAPQLWGGWGQVGLLIAVGIVFTFARAITRTVVASYLLHVSYNSFLFLAFVIASHGLRQLPTGQ
jgi:uncharacterized protein